MCLLCFNCVALKNSCSHESYWNFFKCCSQSDPLSLSPSLMRLFVDICEETIVFIRMYVGVSAILRLAW